MYTAPYTGEYIITLNGAGGGVDNQFGLSPERTSLGGKTTIRVKAEKGIKKIVEREEPHE